MQRVNGVVLIVTVVASAFVIAYTVPRALVELKQPPEETAHMKSNISIEFVEQQIQELSRKLQEAKEKAFNYEADASVNRDEVGFEIEHLKRQVKVQIEHFKETLGGMNKEQAVTMKTMETMQDEMAENEEETKSEIREGLWRETEMMLKGQEKSKRFPNVIGLGIKKCGSFAFTYFTRDHPLIGWRFPPEGHYFDKSEVNNETLEEYRLSFPKVEGSVIVGEKTPSYFITEGVPEMIKETFPDAKVYVILCDPAARVISDLAHIEDFKLKKDKELDGTPTIEGIDEYLEEYLPHYAEEYNVDPNSYISEKLLNDQGKYGNILSTGFYDHHLYRWLKAGFNSSNLMIIDGGVMLKDPGQVVEDFQDFLGIPKLILREDFFPDAQKPGFFCFKTPGSKKAKCLNDTKTRTRNGQTIIPDETVEKLRSLYKPHKTRLESMAGRTFDWGY